MVDVQPAEVKPPFPPHADRVARVHDRARNRVYAYPRD